MQSPLAKQTILITGAAAGLGATLAHQLTAHDAELVLLDRAEEQLERVATQVSALGARVHALACDISDHEDVDRAFETLSRTVGHLDVLVNNAGIFCDDATEALDPARRQALFLVNSLGPIQVTHAALPLLRRSPHVAQVLNVISASGASDTPSGDNRRWSTYGATKSALAGWTATLTAQLQPDGIKVSGIFPGGFESDLYENAGSSEEQHDAPWMMRTEDVADVVVFALTRPADVQLERVLVTKRFAPDITG